VCLIGCCFVPSSIPQYRATVGSRGSLRAVPPDLRGLRCELDFGFLGSTGCLTAFENVLFAGTRGLDHLVVGAVTPLQKALAEPHRAVIHNPGFLEGEEFFVTAMRWDEGVGVLLAFVKRRRGPKGR